MSWAGNLHSVWCISPRAVPGIQTSQWSSDTSPGTNVTRNGECVKKVFLHLNPRCCKVGNLKLDVDGRFALCEVSIHARQEKLSLDDVNFRKLLECFDISDLRMILARGQDYAMDFLVHWTTDLHEIFLASREWLDVPHRRTLLWHVAAVAWKEKNIKWSFLAASSSRSDNIRLGLCSSSHSLIRALNLSHSSPGLQAAL